MALNCGPALNPNALIGLFSLLLKASKVHKNYEALLESSTQEIRHGTAQLTITMALLTLIF